MRLYSIEDWCKHNSDEEDLNPRNENDFGQNFEIVRWPLTEATPCNINRIIKIPFKLRSMIRFWNSISGLLLEKPPAIWACTSRSIILHIIRHNAINTCGIQLFKLIKINPAIIRVIITQPIGHVDSQQRLTGRTIDRTHGRNRYSINKRISRI